MSTSELLGCTYSCAGPQKGTRGGACASQPHVWAGPLGQRAVHAAAALQGARACVRGAARRVGVAGSPQSCSTTRCTACCCRGCCTRQCPGSKGCLRGARWGGVTGRRRGARVRAFERASERESVGVRRGRGQLLEARKFGGLPASLPCRKAERTCHPASDACWLCHQKHTPLPHATACLQGGLPPKPHSALLRTPKPQVPPRPLRAAASLPSSSSAPFAPTRQARHGTARHGTPWNAPKGKMKSAAMGIQMMQRRSSCSPWDELHSAGQLTLSGAGAGCARKLSALPGPCGGATRLHCASA